MTFFAKYTCKAFLLLLLIVFSSSGSVVNLFIDSTKTTNGSGDSWSQAYKDFNSVPGRIRTISTDTVVVRVAKGTYYLDSMIAFNSTHLVILGGYKNRLSGTDTTNRNPDSNNVSISGDTEKNDTLQSDGTYRIYGNNLNALFKFSSTDVYLNGLEFKCTSDIYDSIKDSETAAVKFLSCYVKVESCKFVSNYSINDAGGIYVCAIKFEVDKSVFIDNKINIGILTDRCAGAIYSDSRICIIKNTVFEKCLSNLVAGAVCAHGDTVQLENNKLINNTAGKDGGALYVRVKKIQSYGDTFSFNNASANGGAINAECDTLNIWNDKFDTNTAVDFGGAVYSRIFIISVKNSVFTGNNANAGDGGGVFSLSALIEMDSSKFINNNALNGGGIYSGGSGYIRNTEIENNIADSCGGGFCGGSWGMTNNLQIIDCKLIRNRANYGGGIFFDLDTLSIEKTEFDEDSAYSGGAICFADSQYIPLFINNSKFTNNIADSTGAAIYANPEVDKAIISNTVFTNNRSSEAPVCAYWRGTFENCLMTNNVAQRSMLITGFKDYDHYTSIRLKNCTIADNIIPDSSRLIDYNDTIQNSIIWNNGAYELSDRNPVYYSIIENWPGDGIMNSSLDPLFVKSGKYPYRPGMLSPAINRGNNSYIDTSIYKTDLAGKARIINNTVDPGAFEYYDTSVACPPCLLATVDSFSIPSAGSITVKLDSVMFGSVGYYASCSDKPVSSLVWSFSGQPENVAVTFNPLTNECTVMPSSDYRPGSQFRMLLRVTDPSDTGMYSERWATFYIVNPGFDICEVNVYQNDVSKTIDGRINVKNNIYPMSLVKNRIYLYDSLTGSIDKMQYIDDVLLTQDSLPKSMGGSNTCGTYSFSINPTSAIVYNYSGMSTGRNLYQWATDTLSGSAGSKYYKKYHKIRFFVKITNGVDRADERILNVPLDFSGPLTTMSVTNYIHSQRITWTSFNDTISDLTLFRIPLGDSPPDSDTFELTQAQISARLFISDSLEDSRLYHYILQAQDIHGNTASSEVNSATSSGLYSIEGRVAGSFDTSVKVQVQLYSTDTAGKMTFVKDTTIGVTQDYNFQDVVNGNYIVKAVPLDPYIVNVSPVKYDVSIMRSSVTVYYFSVHKNSVIEHNGVRVEQMAASGDLKFTVKTNRLYVGERPKAVELRWDSGDSLSTSTQMFTINTYSEVPDTSGSATWTFIITRQEIQDSILSRGDTTFTKDIQYVDSRLITQQSPYTPDFRAALWNYPESDSSDMLLFAGQCFRQPQKPYVSTPMASDSSVNFTVRPLNAAQALSAVVKIHNITTATDVLDSTFMSYDISIPNSSDSAITRKLDWKYLAGIENSPKGNHFLSGWNTRDTDSVRIGCKFLKGDTLAGLDSSTVSWMVKLPSKAEYCLWMYIEDTVKKNTDLKLKVNADSAYSFLIKLNKGNAPGWYKSGKLTLPAFDTARVTLVNPANDVLFSTFAIKKSNKGYPTPSDYINAVNRGEQLQTHNLNIGNLAPDNQYSIMVYLKDRYGNTSDTVTDTVNTRAVYDSSALTIHQNAADGNLVLTINKGVSNPIWLDSMIVTVDSTDYPIALHEALSSGSHSSIVITRDKLKKLIPLEKFNHHAKYEKIALVFSADTICTVVQAFEKNVDDSLSCLAIGGIYSEKRTSRKHWSWRHFRVKRTTTTTRTCSYTVSTQYHDTIRTGRIPVRWLDPGASLVASQEFRTPPAPVLDTMQVSAGTILLSCNNYSRQMAGVLKYSFKPGELCADSTVDSIEFGNRFTMNSGWIAGRPSFSGAIRSDAGIWRQNGLNGARHQWLDSYDTAKEYTGGEFYPDIGVSIDPAEIAGGSPSVYPDGFPYISAGIHLASSEASNDHSSPQEKFNLWVLPSKVNTMSNSGFFWGLDGVPIVSPEGSAYCPDLMSIEWIKGPSVYIDSGNHNIDLFMKDDGVGIAAIALSKDTAHPFFTPDLLRQWGDSGFNLMIKAKELPHGTNITFTSQAIDRYGNSSPCAVNTVKTHVSANAVPRLVITPAEGLENGYYQSQYPAFTITTASAVEDSLTLLLRLRQTENSGTPIDIVIPVTTVEKNVWNAAIDSAAPLPEFPADDTIISSRNNYSLYVCALRAPSDTGTWTKLQFGIRADSTGTPATVVIDDPYFTEPDIRYLYKRGMQVAPNTIIGDLEIMFESDSSISQTQQLYAENVRITTDTVTDSSGFHHKRILSVDCSLGNLSAYECSEFDQVCSKVPLFTFNYGKYTIETDPDSMSFQTSGSVKYIASAKSVIIDDTGSRCRISSEATSMQPLKINYTGCTDTFYVSNDYFFIKNAVQFGTVHDGFNLRSCKSEFIRNRTDSVYSTYSITVAGCDTTCGPFLNYTVLNPKYLEKEFSADEKMKRPLIVNYSSSNPEYSLQFKTGTADTVEMSDLDGVSYNGWKLRIGSYEFNNAGIRLLDFDVQPLQDIFPADSNGNPEYLEGFSNVMISGLTGLNDSALHLSGNTAISDPALKLTTTGNYRFQNIPSISFESVDSTREYQLSFATGTRLALPTWCEPAISTYSNDHIIDSIIDTVSVFKMKQDGISQFEANGDFRRTVGKIDGDASKPGLLIDATNRITYAAHDFQIKIIPKTGVPIFRLLKGFFDGCDTVNITNGSIGIFSDLSINTLYGKTKFKMLSGDTTAETVYSITPKKFSMLTLPASGIDIMNSKSGIQVLLLAPKIDLAGLGLDTNSTINSIVDIYNASFDCSKNLRGLNARFKMPDGSVKLSNINKEIAKIADIELDEIHLGYSADADGKVDKVEIGAAATMTFGSTFKNIGLQNERLFLDDLTVGYSPDNSDLSLESLHARAFALPRKIGIGPRNFSDGATSAADYVEIISGGNGLKVDYINSATSDSDKKLIINMNNWSIKLTDSFPVPALRNISFVLDTFEYVKDYVTQKGNITKLGAKVEWRPKDGTLGFDNYNLRQTRISLGCESSQDTANKSNLSGYFKIAFDSVEINGKLYSCAGGGSHLKVYFDGSIDGSASIKFMDTIPVVPLNSDDPKVFINPGDTGTTVELSFKTGSESKLLLKLTNVHLQSKDSIPALKKKLDINVETLECGIENTKPVLKSLAVSTTMNDTLINNSTFTVMTDSLKVGYNETGYGGLTGKVFWIEAGVKFNCNFMTSVNAECKPTLGTVVKVDSDSPEFDFTWKVPCDIKGEIAKFNFGAKLKISSDTIGFDSGFVEMNVLKDAEILSKDDSKNPNNTNGNIGVAINNLYFVKNGGSWHWINVDADHIKPTFSIGKGFDILGVRVYGEMDLSRLFNTNPGIAIDNIGIGLKGKEPTYNTGFSLIIDGNKPYVHPEWSKPKKLVIKIPSIDLGSLKLGSALMEFGVDRDTLYDYESWYFRGQASMSIGVVDPLEVDVAFEKPHPWQNVTGIRHAKVTVKLKNAARIPIGTTPFYISGFFGAMYDGLGMPEGAIQCGIKELPPGLKIEAAIFIEFESPEVVNGKVGFWVHLRSINFGVNGKVKALKGVVDADVCMALYNSGKAFHGHFIVTAELALALQGRFVIDIWGDETGGNFTADAGAKVGLNRGSILKKKWIKIPTRTLWFLDLFTNMGKFDNEQNGVTTGVRIIGKTFGIGVVGGKFCIGNLGKYKLKPSPVASRTTRTMLRAAPLSSEMETNLAASAYALSTEYDTCRLGLVNLDGGELISVVAAADTSVVWGDDALKFAWYNTDPFVSSWVIDNDAGHYLSEAHFGDDSKTDSNYSENMNTISRMWYNKRERKLDSLAILLPKQNSGEDHYEFLVFASLIPPVSALNADTFTNSASEKIVKFNGTVENYQGTIRSIVKDTSKTGTQPDTILKQMMRLNFYYAKATPVIDSTALNEKQFIYGYKRIPFEQFSGYTQGDTSILDNDNVEYSPITKKLTINNLEWNTANADSGVYKFFSAVELIDFITEDENGVKSILPDSAIDSAMCVRENPLALTEINRPDSFAVVTVTREAAPLSKPQGFSATGSVLTNGTEDSDERRDIYLRWVQDYNSSLAGYEIEIWPQSDVSAKRTFTIGPVNRYKITIPELSSFYVADCDSAGGDSNEVAKMCGNAITDFAYYNDSLFKVVITPFSYRDTVIYEDLSDTSDFYVNDTVGMGKFMDKPGFVRVETKRKIVDMTMSDTANVKLGTNSGNPQNDLKMEFSDGKNIITSSDTIDVALNEVSVIKTKILVSNRSSAISASSDYAESYSVVKGYGAAPLPDSMALRLPSTGISAQWFDLGKDTIIKSLTFSPSQRDYRCREMFTFACTSSTENCGCHENKCDSDTADCDPNKAYNDRPKMDPCNGNGDALVRGRSPFGVYKVNVYAINNGRRSVPAFNSAAGPSVYDSLHFRIIAPAPKLHGLYPDYIRHASGKIYNDTLHIRASELWIDTNSLTDTFKVRLTWNNNADSIILPVASVHKIELDRTNRDAEVEDVTSADYELIVPSPDSLTNADDGEKISVQIVNSEIGTDSYANVSNVMYLTYLNKFTDLECNSDYSSDSVNSEFAMNFLGAYNRSPGVDTSAKKNNDTVTAYFSRIYDYDRSNYEIVVTQGSNSFNVTEFSVEDDGLRFRLPAAINGTDTIRYEFRYLNTISPCAGKTWTAMAVPHVKASFEIVNVYGGCYLAVLGGDASKNTFRYTLGINADAWPYGITSAYRLLPVADTVKIKKSTYVTFIINDKDGGNSYHLTKWVDAGEAVKLTDNSHNVLPFEFTARTGDTLRFKVPGNGSLEPFQPVLSYTWAFNDGVEHSEDHIVLKATDSCPLTVQTWYITPDTTGKMVRIKGPVMVYCPEVIVPSDPHAIRIPSSRILDAISNAVSGYPLLVRLDTAIISWDSIKSKQFYFADRDLVPLAHEIESVDSAAKVVNCWVRMDYINAESPDNMLYLVTGDTSNVSSKAVWDKFVAVYHCKDDTAFTDATQKHTVNSTSLLNKIDGVSGNGNSFTGAIAVSASSELSVNNTGISVSAWIKVDSADTVPANGSPVLKSIDSDGNTVLCLTVMPDMSIMFIAGSDTIRTVKDAIERDVWLYTGASYGWFNSDGIGKIFVNGVIAGSGLMNSGNAIAYKRPLTMSIGGDGSGKFCGKLDEIRISSSKLPDNWFVLDYYSQRRLNDFLKYRKYVSEITRVSDIRCELTGNAECGQKVYTDNNACCLYDLPSAYRGMVMLRQPFSNLKRDTDTLFNVSVNGTAAITVLADTTCAVPSFLSGWRNTGTVAYIVDSSRGKYTGFAMYEKVIDSAETVAFGNYGSDVCRNGSLPYIVLFDLYNGKSSISAIVNSDIPLKKYQVTADGELLHLDRETVFDTMPKAFGNGLLIASSNTFKSDTSDAFMRITVDERSRLHVIADSASLPEFVQSGWQKENNIEIGGNSSYAVYGKSVRAGFISLAGPSKGKPAGSSSSYSVVLTKESSQCLVEDVTPFQYEAVCAGIDTGSYLYTDTNITVTAISEALRNITFIKTLESDTNRMDSVRMSFTLNKNAYVYCALDSAQKLLPAFMTQDDGNGVWKYCGLTLRNSENGSYNIWKKFFRSGYYSFSAVRSGGDTANRFNYVFFAKKYSGDIDTTDTTLVYPFTEGSEPYSGLSTIKVNTLPHEIDSLTLKRLEPQKTDCDTAVLRYSFPVRIYLGVASYIAAEGTFIENDGWQATSYTIGFNRLISDYKVFVKELAANETVRIPQIGCFGYNPSAFNHLILIEKLEYPVRGYRTTDVSVNSVGNTRRAQSDNYMMRNIDIAYSYGLRMQSTSYQMNIMITGSTRKTSDTTRILSPFVDTVVTSAGTSIVQNGLSKTRSTTAVSISKAAQLPDLYPVLVNADSVTVNTIDLRSEGAVRVIFTNKSDIEIKEDFTVVLFEDNDGDYQYNSSIDKYLGKAIVKGIAAREYAVYHITLSSEVSFPNRTMFAFIDADRWVSESNERNNTLADKGICRDYELKDFIADKKEMESFYEKGASFLPDFTDTIIGCYLHDSNKDGVTDKNDSLCIVYSSQYRLHFMNALTGDSLCASVPVNSAHVKNIAVRDLNGDNVPEIIAGNAVYKANGILVADYSSKASVSNGGLGASLDFDGDNVKDSAAISGEFVTIWSGYNSSLLYVNPVSQWTGIQGAATSGVVSEIASGAVNCFNVNVSYPRLSAKGSTDTSEITIRTGNAGNTALEGGVNVSVYADTNSSVVNNSMPPTAILLAEMNSGTIAADKYEDLKAELEIGSNVKRLWFIADKKNKFIECNESDNSVKFDIGQIINENR